MDSKCSTTTKRPLNILSKYLEKCNEKLPYGYQVPFLLHLQEELRPFWALFLFIFISRNYTTDFIQGDFLSLTTIL